MIYNLLGNTGVQLSVLGLGTARIPFDRKNGELKTLECIQQAFDLGINHIDTAENYGFGISEMNIGYALKELRANRSDVIVSSKVYRSGDGPNRTGLSRKRIVEGCKTSLKRLQLEYLDILYCHAWDEHTALIDVIRSMNILIDQGYILYWGICNWSIEKIRETLNLCEKFQLIPPSVVQCEFNPATDYKFIDELDAVITPFGGIIGYSPLGCGVLTAKYLKGIHENTLLSHPDYERLKKQILEESNKYNLIAEKLKAFAVNYTLDPAQIALLWAITNNRICSVLIGVRNKEQLNHNFEIFSFMNEAEDIVKQFNSYLINET